MYTHMYVYLYAEELVSPEGIRAHDAEDEEEEVIYVYICIYLCL